MLADILSLVFLVLLYYFMRNPKFRQGNKSNIILSVAGFVVLSSIFFISCGLAIDIIVRYGVLILIGVGLYIYFKRRG